MRFTVVCLLVVALMGTALAASTRNSHHRVVKALQPKSHHRVVKAVLAEPHPVAKITEKQDLDQWLMDLLQMFFDMFGDSALDMLQDLLSQLGLDIPDGLLQELWDMLFPLGKEQHKPMTKQDLDQWLMDLLQMFFDMFGDSALDMLQDLLSQLGLDIPDDLLSQLGLDIPDGLLQELWDMLFPKSHPVAKITEKQDLDQWLMDMLQLFFDMFGEGALDMLQDLLSMLGLDLPDGLLQELWDQLFPLGKKQQKQDLFDWLSTFFQLLLDMFGDNIFDQLNDILSMLGLDVPDWLLDLLLGLFFPKSHHLTSRQDLWDWLMSLMSLLFDMFGDSAFDLLQDLLSQLGLDIPDDLLQMLWDMLFPVAKIPIPKSVQMKTRFLQDLLDMLLEFGLDALLDFLGQFLPPDLLQMLLDLLFGGFIPYKH
ncbi:unnamed protein product [Darwinula stevensoni]|uniref:Uncharacterized protein n=1 Tax=Darwinula stevensoni TaxID=69355 RepID=A0A7R8X0R1_9CRUS|nr:unnamed protein product [Darwinula stevensoni]CAG0879441.1 unnamed protein product [Darwinula stevensoni]